MPVITGERLYIIMITRKDCILLLSELSARGIDTSMYLQKCVRAKDIDYDVVKFINNNRQLDTVNFYNKIRKSYNIKKSMLYKNIVTCDEVDCTETVLTTLSALSLQILLFKSTVENENMFIDNMRLAEIHESILNYTKTYDLVPCIQLLQIIKADLKAFEYIGKNNS